LVVRKSLLKNHTVVMVILMMVFCIQSLNSIYESSATFDEVQNFGLGKYLLAEHKWDVMGSIAHPPVGFYLTSLPLLLWDEDKRYWDYEEGVNRKDLLFLGAVDVYRGQAFLSSGENRDDRLLKLSRSIILALTLLLGYYIFRLSREFYGDYGGLLSLAIFAFCPNLLAYSGIATQDMPLAVFWFITCYYFWVFLQKNCYKAAVLTGIFLGLAFATKFTSFLLIPLQLSLYLIYIIKNHIRPDFKILIIYAVSAFVLSASYRFDMTPFFQGIELLKLEMTAGQSAFFHGELSNHGWWNFYLAALLLKTPIPVTILFAAAVALHIIKKRWFTLLFLIAPVITLLIVSSCSNFAIGTRYLLPIYPLMYVSIGQLADTGKRAVILIVILLCWLAVSSLHVAPHYLAYFNELIGGPSNGYKYLVDSNLDWGQSLKTLKKYMDEHGVKRVSLSYFGADSPQRYGIDYDWLPSHHLYNPESDKAVYLPQNQLLAISVTNLQGVYLQNRNEFTWLMEYEPVAKIGYSIFIYDLTHRKLNIQ